jgi:glutathione-specific gamma-glutamylcyclotransferase
MIAALDDAATPADPGVDEAQRPAPGSGTGVWIFAYGSLMWRPGFTYREAVAARLPGYHRSLCVYSYIHRGTPERPGLVLGLDRGGSCRGLAFRVDPEREAEVLAYLDQREMGTAVYERRRLSVVTAHGRVVAWCYVVRRDHPQYAGRLPAARCLDLVLDGIGQSGRNVEYVINTVTHLEQFGIKDRPLGDLALRLRADCPQG